MFSHKIDEYTELRPIQLHHAEELNSLVSHNFEHISEWSWWLKDKERPIEDTRKWIVQNLEHFARNEGFAIGIWYQGAMAGQIDYGNLNSNDRKMEIGYWLGKSFQGKGLVTKSCIVLINHAFDVMKLNRVEMRCAVANKKSRKIPEKLGFREEGILREAAWLHDHFVDEVVYAMLASEWNDEKTSDKLQFVNTRPK